MPAPPLLRRLVRGLAWSIAMSVAAFVTWTWLRPELVPPVSPGVGIALAAMLVEGATMLPWVFAAFATSAALVGAPAAGATAAAVIGTLQVVAAWTAIRHAFRLRGDLASLREVSLFFVAALVASLLGATLGAAGLLRFASPAEVPPVPTWLYLWTSQMLGVLLFVPPLYATFRDTERPGWNRGTLESLASSTLALALAGALFLAPGVSINEGRLLPLAALPLLAWGALRGPRMIALWVPVPFVMLAVAGSQLHVGVFENAVFPVGMLTLQGMASAIAVSTLAITSTEHSRRMAHRATRAREAQLRRVLESTRDGFWEWDGRAQRLDVSARLCELLGVAPGELSRYPDSFLERAHPDDSGVARAIVIEHLRGSGEPYHAEYRVRHADGHCIWVLERARVAERDTDGRPLRVAGTLTDISRRKLAERELRAAREMFESFMRHSPALAAIRDAQGRVLFMNDTMVRSVWGDHPPEWHGRHVRDLFPPPVAEIILATDRRVFESGQSVVEERQLYAPREPMTGIVMKFPLRGPDGEPLVGGVAVDVTAQRQAEANQRAFEARLDEEQRLESLGRMAGGVAHDFNNILTGILGWTDLAREQLPPGDDTQPYLTSIRQGAQRASALTRQMLACSGRTRTEVRPVALDELVREMQPLLEVSIPRHVKLEVLVPEALPPVMADESQLRPVVTNLVLNAAEASGGSGGTVTVRLTSRRFAGDDLASRWSAELPPAGPYVSLEVTDHGCGMGEETLAHVFDPFFTTKFPGRGLGLPAALGIVRAHGGVMQVESTLALGSTFRVLLPACASDAAPEPPAHTGTWRAEGVVLVVDDEPGVRDMAGMLLRRIGFDEVLVAATGAEGIECFRANAGRIRVVLLDLHLPDVHGVRVLAAMRDVRADVCVLVSTGDAAPEWPRTHGEPPAGFVPKPYRLSDLARAVRDALATAPA